MANPAEYEGDAVADAIAFVECARRDDRTGVSALIMNSSWLDVLLLQTEFIGQFCDEEGVTPEHFRAWAKQQAARRGS